MLEDNIPQQKYGLNRDVCVLIDKLQNFGQRIYTVLLIMIAKESIIIIINIGLPLGVLVCNNCMSKHHSSYFLQKNVVLFNFMYY